MPKNQGKIFMIGIATMVVVNQICWSSAGQPSNQLNQRASKRFSSLAATEEQDHNLKFVVFPDDYNKNLAPPSLSPPSAEGSGGGGSGGCPALVNVSANLKSILAIDEPNQVISIETTIRLSWFDPRIRVTLPEGQPDSVPYLLFNR